MRDARIIGLVEKASSCEGLTSMIHALDAYTSCLRFIIYNGSEDMEVEQKNAKDTIAASKNISLNAWSILKEINDGHTGAGPREAFRSAIQRVLEQLSEFKNPNHDNRDLANKYPSKTSGISLGDLLRSSRWHCLALHSWLYAPDSTSRRDSDVTRTCLCDADTRDGHARQVQIYVMETRPTKLLSQLLPIIKSQDASERTLAFILDLLISAVMAHHTRLVLWDKFEVDLCQIVWTIMRSGTSENRRSTIARASNLLT
ncbi:hypothetical protein BDZ94DRAFT_1305815 [Collybia nuda]|uniref:Uncharacterized protein n=1 Tax=Collybia nuda TaxID=64659 RepID=A0A9P5YDN2_9AGAR|nr:hypothetical protein BDZ94DRAFT_1305815 [Collybia nuda]